MARKKREGEIVMQGTFRFMAVFIFTVIISLALTTCGGGGGGEEGATGGAAGGAGGGEISGSVSGTTVIAVDDRGDVIASDDTAGRPPDLDRDGDGIPESYSFTLVGIPAEANFRIYLVTGAGVFPMYFDSDGDGVPEANVLSLTSVTDIFLGYVDTSSGVAVPTNNPLDQGCISGGENTDMSGVFIDAFQFSGTSDYCCWTSEEYTWFTSNFENVGPPHFEPSNARNAPDGIYAVMKTPSPGFSIITGTNATSQDGIIVYASASNTISYEVYGGDIIPAEVCEYETPHYTCNLVDLGLNPQLHGFTYLGESNTTEEFLGIHLYYVVKIKTD